MELILWRHADAETGEPDISRRLTPKGKRQATVMARWLGNYLPKNTKILVSPAVRTRQTADALTSKYQVTEALGPDKGLHDLLAAAGWPNSNRAVVLVGHNPAISQLAAFLLSGNPAEWTIRKGAAWWLTNRVRQGESPVVLKAAMSPGMARRGKSR
jgi:phosphohistidine phosphatase